MAAQVKAIKIIQEIDLRSKRFCCDGSVMRSADEARALPESTGEPTEMFRKLRTRGADVLASRFLADARRLVTGTFFGQLIGLVASPILTRIFSPDDFGIFSSLFAATMFIAAFGALRLESLIPATHRQLEALRLVQFMIALSVVTAVLVLFGIMFRGDDLARLLSIPKGGAAV